MPQGDSGSGAIYEEADGTLRIIGVFSNTYPVFYGSQGGYVYVGGYHSSWIQENIDSIDKHVGAPLCGKPSLNVDVES